MSNFRRFLSLIGCFGIAFHGFIAAPILWSFNPVSAFLVLGCVLMVFLEWLHEAITGRQV